MPGIFHKQKTAYEITLGDWSSDVCSSDLKINANVHLLSGGEKAMTAVALIFAIFHLNPSPVCLLDDVDAPLDDANVSRFAALIKEMSEEVQFLVITHNKITMEMADYLMGVTMQEPGVSRLVSVDVDEAAAMAV